MIYVQKCGKDVAYWVCRKHDTKSDMCSSIRISQYVFECAFVRMYNKLSVSYREILTPILVLQQMRIKKTNGNTRVLDIYKELAKQREQIHVLTRLKFKGFLDEAKYLEQTSSINLAISRLDKELKNINRNADEDDDIKTVDFLISYIEKNNRILYEFSSEIFETIVEKIIVKDNTLLEFNLIGRFRFTEIIKEN